MTNQKCNGMVGLAPGNGKGNPNEGARVIGMTNEKSASVWLTCWALRQRTAVGNPNEGARVTGMTNEKEWVGNPNEGARVTEMTNEKSSSVSLTCWALHQGMAVGNPNMAQG
ncbi:hypothetical protein BJV77DRAFT_963589 [Russula vinacea]|nr:hypothetical protein BJV77DRAFT_963589 [Russula vinacea]